MTSLVDLYQQELKLLKESAQVFSEEYPALTESLTRETADPDVEMILQGVSYLTAQFKQQINDQFPVALQALSQALTPSLMQPIPATSILSMEPKANLLTPLKVATGRGFDSIPVALNDSSEPIPCRFTNAWPVEVLPVQVGQVSLAPAQSEINGVRQRVLELSIKFDSSKNDLANYDFDKLRLFINLPSSEASLWMLMLYQQLLDIEVIDSSASTKLGKSSLALTGFDLTKSLFGHHGTASVHQVLQEYYMVPEKFQFADVALNDWQQRRGESFELKLTFTPPNINLPELTSESIKLYCTPIVNEFEHYAEPTAMNGVQLEFPLSAKQRSASIEQDLPIIDVLQVESIKKDRERNRRYQSLVRPEPAAKNAAGYHFYRKPGQAVGQHNQSVEAISNWLSLQFEAGTRPTEPEVLRVKVKCCHGAVAAKIEPGEVNQATSSSPELVKFTNLTTATDYQGAVVTSHAAWQVVSDQALSLQNINSVEQLQDLLSHHIPSQLAGKAKQKTLQHRIDAIEQLTVMAKDNFDNGVLKRGVLYQVTINSAHFINEGESFLFAALLDQIFALQIPLNSFSQLQVTDSRTGSTRVWPIRSGSSL